LTQQKHCRVLSGKLAIKRFSGESLSKFWNSILAFTSATASSIAHVCTVPKKSPRSASLEQEPHADVLALESTQHPLNVARQLSESWARHGQHQSVLYFCSFDYDSFRTRSSIT
jgi:hypothetical protein